MNTLLVFFYDKESDSCIVMEIVQLTLELGMNLFIV